MATNNNSAYECIKDRLRKIQALAEGGYAGEAEAAKRILENLCRQHGVSMDDILDKEKISRYRFNVGRSKIYLRLFVQCHASVTGKKSMKYGKVSGSDIILDLTAYQAAELANLFFWHKTNLKKDLEKTQELVFEAYINKHHIIRDKSNDPEGEEEEPVDFSSIDFEHLKKVLYMQETLNDNKFRKMIEK